MKSHLYLHKVGLKFKIWPVSQVFAYLPLTLGGVTYFLNGLFEYTFFFKQPEAIYAKIGWQKTESLPKKRGKMIQNFVLALS